ncbi:hypothetical protein BS636_15135 [Acinetobacter sp. LoGeW2-3]|uniref:hypothetical protein n=1 Tax=Acinetobacter sp. LoGeW2-3 TaxID=1808001 RepID=UPI000C05BD10|nr:hypothetical protein [Acinetobacter sp. LoGeW2-3]ATO20915.1 hypothetical protein BS636_15135 [Acinetobacter sp. LoGeW2-3]
MKYLLITMTTFALLLTGCATTNQRVLDSEQSQVQLRSIQTRTFETTDKDKTLRAVIATLQDLGFVIDKADETLGTVTGTKLNRYTIKMTVTVRSHNNGVLVRANGQYNITPITDPIIYQNFFTSLEKAMFLQANAVD